MEIVSDLCQGLHAGWTVEGFGLWELGSRVDVSSFEVQALGYGRFDSMGGLNRGTFKKGPRISGNPGLESRLWGSGFEHNAVCLTVQDFNYGI